MPRAWEYGEVSSVPSKANGRLEETITLSPETGKESVMASRAEPIASPKTLIELLDNENEWFVRVVENGHETINTFYLESFAATYAEGQRLRLGLKFVERY